MPPSGDRHTYPLGPVTAWCSPRRSHRNRGSFTDRRDPVKGAGRALFAKTLADCRARGGTAIIAKITADNASGLAYYARMGFRDWQVWKDDATRGGRPIDRVVKRFPLD